MVSRRSPQTERFVGIINLLTVDTSGQGVTLSEISRRLGVSKATLYPMLEALAEAGFLTRHPSRKTFHLGPALVAAGHAAAKRNPRLERASEAMLRLGAELDSTCWLYGADGAHLRVIDQAWHSRKVSPIMRVGERFPFQPPAGSVFVAWADERQVAAWLDRGGLTDDERSATVERLAAIRRQGYTVELEHIPIEELRAMVTQLANTTAPADRARLLDRLTDKQVPPSAALLTDPDDHSKYSVHAIDAPIFDDSGEVTMAIGLINMPLLDRRRIQELAQSVKAAAAVVNGRF